MLNIIPMPRKLEESDGKFSFKGKLGAYISPEIEKTAGMIGEVLPFTDFSEKSDSKCKFVILFDASLKNEAYTMVCNENGVKVCAAGFAGAYYAAVTLKQILFFDLDKDEIGIPFLKIYDEPKFGYRGLQLDEARHFFGKQTVKKFIDTMAFYKLNRFHWHLTDDQGWRIEIKKYPRLVEIGSKRKDSQIGGWKSCKFDGKPHSGYYTQEDIKEIVAYAAERNVTVIPEIDMPAHFASAMAAYNYLGCREIPCEVHWFFGGEYPTRKAWFDFNRSACVGKESTYEFIFGVIDEIAELFPAPYFHIGGDEAPKAEWTKCPECKKKIDEEGLAGVHELQGYFNNRIAAYLKTKGKQLIVWNEALESKNLGADVIGQYWTVKIDKNVGRFLNRGGQLILSKHEAFYFDMTYYQYPLKNTYDFEPTNLVSEKYTKNVIGYEGELWSEWITTPEKLEMYTYPRAFALSEITWSSAEKNFDEFLKRTEYHERILDSMGINYAVPEVASPQGKIKRKFEEFLWSCGHSDREFEKNQKLKSEKGRSL